MWRFLVLSVFVLTVCAVSGGSSSKGSSEGSSKRKTKTDLKLCGKKLGEGSICYNGYWTGICVASKDKPSSKKHLICRQSCIAAPKKLDPSENVELVGIYDTQNAFEGASLTVKCNKGYVAADGSSMKLTCVNGTWSKFTGKCEKVCMDADIQEITNMDLITNTIGVTFKVGDLLLFTCKEDHVSTGTSYAKCQADGTWTSSGSGCVRDCGDVPPTPDDAVIDIIGGTTLNEEVTYSCKAGTASSDPMKHTCTTKGWQLTGLSCKAVT